MRERERERESDGGMQRPKRREDEKKRENNSISSTRQERAIEMKSRTYNLLAHSAHTHTHTGAYGCTHVPCLRCAAKNRFHA